MPGRSNDTGRNTVKPARLVLGCVRDDRARSRLHTALRGHSAVEWYDTFTDLRRAIERVRHATVVISVSDAQGASAAAFARAVRRDVTGTPVVACCNLPTDSPAIVSELAAAGVHDILFMGVNDDGHTARMVIFGAAVGAAADVVMATISPRLPIVLVRFMDVAVHRPRELRRVTEVAAALNVPRQTVGRWCRAARCMQPEELLVWARLLLVSALIENSERTLEAIANDLHYGSPTALRNRIREYTGITATSLREAGLAFTADLFFARLEDLRSDNGRAASARQRRPVLQASR